MKRISVVWSLFLVLALMLLAGCASSSDSNQNSALSAGNNIALATRILNENHPGFYVFSAPWENISALLTNIKTAKGYSLNLPATYTGTNYVYVISITPSGDASLVTFDSKLKPPTTYPVLPPPPIGNEYLNI